jgi:hypothetical protein
LVTDILRNPETKNDTEIFTYVAENWDKLSPDKQKTYAEVRQEARELYNEI